MVVLSSMTSKSAMSPCIQPKKNVRKRGGVEKGGGGRRREERKRKDLENVLPSSRTQNIYIFLSSSCLSHFPSCPFIHFPTPSLPRHPLFRSWHLCHCLVICCCFLHMSSSTFFFSLFRLPLSLLSPSWSGTYVQAQRTHKHTAVLTSLCTFQWRTLQTFSTACLNVDVKTRSSSPARLINRKQALFKVGVLAMMPGGETGILLLEDKDSFQMLGGSVNSQTVTNLRLAKSHV